MGIKTLFCFLVVEKVMPHGGAFVPEKSSGVVHPYKRDGKI